MTDHFAAKAIVAVALLLGSSLASALPSGFGTSCSLNGGSGASSGSPGALGSDSQTVSGGCTAGQARSVGIVAVPVLTDGGPSIHTFTQQSNTEATARAGLGGLGVSSLSAASSTPQSYLFLSNGVGGITENEYGASGNSSAIAEWHDLLTVGGTANANGFIVLRFSMELHGQTFASLSDVASAGIQSRFFIDDFYRYRSDQILDLTRPGMVSTTIGFRPGDQVQLYGDLSASTSAFAGRQSRTICSGFICFPVRGDYFASSNAFADAANSADFHVDVLTPGGVYSTLSGASYLTAAVNPVPEPSTWILFASGLLAIGKLARRRIARQREAD